ncbi:MAG TPA: hypothetical protein VHS34_09185 [Terriglobales bacterium]|nr:hypothetical protein [Terriglobales bacterium]
MILELWSTREPREVSVTKRVRTARGLRYSPVVISANGRIKPDAVYIDGKEERHPEGSYYLSWYAGKRLMRESVGKDAATATAAARRQQKEAELNARNNGIAILPEAYRRPLSVAVAEYLEDTAVLLRHRIERCTAYTTPGPLVLLGRIAFASVGRLPHRRHLFPAELKNFAVPCRSARGS